MGVPVDDLAVSLTLRDRGAGVLSRGRAVLGEVVLHAHKYSPAHRY